MQDNSKTTPQKNTSAKENVFIQIKDDPLKIKHLLRKNILLLISYT
jgi:hypothetical protein